jgi:hypothetical protein
VISGVPYVVKGLGVLSKPRVGNGRSE